MRSLNNVGDVRRDQGDLPGALAAYDESLRIMRDLAARDPGNAGLDARRLGQPVPGRRRPPRPGRPPGALAAYDESLRIMRDLAARDPGNAGWMRDVSVNLDGVGTSAATRATSPAGSQPTTRA